MRRYVGKEKLLALGFRQIGKRTFCLTRKRWDDRSHGFVEDAVGRLTLDSKGYVVAQSDGMPMLRQR